MIKKAIIPVAGWGTRWFPITKSIEKCMLPIGNRPIVDYVVKDCIDAGVSDIYFVVAEGATQLKQFYSSNEKLDKYLRDSGKIDQLDKVTAPVGVTFHYIEQPQNDKYGTAVPIALAESYIDEGESVVVLMGDDFVYSNDGTNDIKGLIDGTSQQGNSLLGVSIPIDQVSRYGVIEMSPAGEYVRIVEKPEQSEAPSNLINISKYVLNKDIVKMAVDFVNTDKTGEYYLTDVINQYVSGGGSVNVVKAKGEYLDGGNPDGWLHANRVIMGDIA